MDRHHVTVYRAVATAAAREARNRKALIQRIRRKSEKDEREYLYRGISARPFKRQFNLADHVQVKSANFENGLLRIELFREIPEAMKPRRIVIGGTGAAKVIEQPKAA